MQTAETDLLLTLLACERDNTWFLAQPSQRDTLAGLTRRGFVTIEHIRPGIFIVSLTNEGRRLGGSYERNQERNDA